MVCDWFQLEDLFVAGLGCDVAGAYLLARGLITSPADLTRNSSSFYDSNSYLAVSVARDKIDGISGLLGLSIGFVLQAAGYLASLGTDSSTATGWPQALVGGALLLLGFLVVMAAGWLHRKLRLLPTLVEMSHYLVDGTREEFSRAALLPDWLKAAGYERRRNDDDLAFARRTAGVQDLIVDVTGERKRRATDPPLPGE